MNVKRKTVRFQDNASDLAVYEQSLTISPMASGQRATWSLRQ